MDWQHVLLEIAAIGVSFFLLSIMLPANATRMPTSAAGAYIDPYTGSFVGLGELDNDGFDHTPWSNVVIAYTFAPANGYFHQVDANISITNPENNSDINPDGYSGNTGNFAYTYNVPPSTSLPFAVTKQFIDKSPTNSASYLEYRGTPTEGNKPLNWTGNWKPSDLIVSVKSIQQVNTFVSPFNNQSYTRWAVNGNALNNQSGVIHNVHIIAGILGNDSKYLADGLIGVAGYGSLAEEEKKAANQTDGLPFASMNGFENRTFTLYATIPANWKPTSASLYAESDESVMLYSNYQPLAAVYDTQGLSYYTSRATAVNGTITFLTNVTNTSRQNMQFDWILQIVKVPFNESDSEQNLSNYLGNGTTEHIEVIHSTVKALAGKQSIRYSWHPSNDGWYAHAIYIVNNIDRPHLIAEPYHYFPVLPNPIMYSEVFYYVPPSSLYSLNIKANMIPDNYARQLLQNNTLFADNVVYLNDSDIRASTVLTDVIKSAYQDKDSRFGATSDTYQMNDSELESLQSVVGTSHFIDNSNSIQNTLLPSTDIISKNYPEAFGVNVYYKGNYFLVVIHRINQT